MKPPGIGISGAGVGFHPERREEIGAGRMPEFGSRFLWKARPNMITDFRENRTGFQAGSM